MIEELTAEIPAEQRKAVLKLIDLKTENDMKEVINSINMLKESVDKSIKHLEDKNAERSKTLYWILGVIVAIMVALKLFF